MYQQSGMHVEQNFQASLANKNRGPKKLSYMTWCLATCRILISVSWVGGRVDGWMEGKKKGKKERNDYRHPNSLGVNIFITI